MLRISTGYSLGVGGLIFNKGKVLLVRRMHEPNKGMWTMPSGYVDPQEPIAEAVKREVWEETKVEAEVLGVVGVRHRISPGDSNILVIFLMRPVGGEPQADKTEVDDVRYFSIDEVEASEDVIMVTKLAVQKVYNHHQFYMPRFDCEPTRGMVISAYDVYLPDMLEDDSFL